MPGTSLIRGAEAEAAWRAAIAGLYQVTLAYRPRRPMEVSPDRAHEPEIRLLARVAREHVPPHAIDYYGFKAMTTCGDERDFRWYLPRLLEALPDNPHAVADPDLVVEKVLWADFDDWPQAEQDAVQDAFAALWRLWLDGGRPWRAPWRRSLFDPHLDGHEILCAAARLDMDVGALVGEVPRRTQEDRALAAEYLKIAEDAADGWLEPPWHNEDDSLDERPVARYFASERSIAELKDLAVHYAGEELGAGFAAVVQRLERNREAQAIVPPDAENRSTSRGSWLARWRQRLVHRSRT